MAAAAKQTTAPSYERPAPTADLVLVQRAAKELELASLERTIGATAHAAL